VTAKALTLSGSDSVYLDRPAAESSIWGWHALTWRFVFVPAAFSTYMVLAGAGKCGNLGAGNDGWLLYCDPAGNLKFRNSSDAGPPGGAGNDYSTGIVLVAGQICDLVITLNPGIAIPDPSLSAVRFWQSGFNTSNAMGSTNLMAQPTLPLTVGIEPPAAPGWAAGIAFKGKFYEIAAWNRMLTTLEIRAVQAAGRNDLLAQDLAGPYTPYPDSSAKVPSGLARLYSFNATPNDESGGPGTHGADLTEYGGPLDYSADTIVFGVPEVAGGGTPPSFIASMVGSEIKLDFAASVLDNSSALDPATYSVTQPVGMPAVTVTGVRMESDTEVFLAVEGDMRLGGTYNVAIPDAGKVFDATDGTPNDAAVNDDFSVAAGPFTAVATSKSYTIVDVEFGRPVKQVSAGASDDALHAANYTITDPNGGTLAVSSVTSLGTSKVRLTTAGQKPVQYSYSFANIKDLAGNVI